MAISDKEPIQRNNEGEVIQPKPYLGSPASREINTSMGGFETFGSPDTGRNGLSIKQLSEFANLKTNQSSFSSPVQSVPRSELIANRRYDTYERGVDLENIYGLQQSWADQLANGVIKMGGLGVGTFFQGFATIPNTIAAMKNGKLSDLSGGADSYEAAIDTWTKNLEDDFPNYFTRKEKEHPYLAMVPFAPGSANFWGDKIIKNLGFTAGAIGSAIVQDAAIGAITEGIGEIPLVANQIGKASLWLNKIFTGTNNIEKTLDVAKAAGVAADKLLDVKKLGEIAVYTKASNGFRYGMSIYGSARTEAAIEARDSYRTVREELIRQYKLDNLGEEPTGAAAEQIEDYATSAMNTRFGINMALLTASNAIQFGNLFKSFTSANKAVTGQLTKELEDLGKIGLKEGSKDVFEKKVAEGIGDKIWDSVRPKLANILSEGVYEEGGQYAAEKGTYDYFTRKYKNLSDPKNKKNWDTVNETITSTLTGLKDQFGTSEGLENMMVGAISALISGGIMGKVDSSRGEGKDARLQSSLNILNQYGLTGILNNQYDNTLSSSGIAKEMDEAAKSGDVFKYKNLKHDMFFNFVQSRIPLGMHDVTIEQLNMLKDMDKEEFEKSFGMDFNSSNKSTVNDYVNSLITEANNVKKTYDSIDFTFKNPFKRIIDPTTKEEEVENNKYNDFNKWKTELLYLSAKVPHINNRLDSIQQSVSEINPQVDNSLLSKLTNRESLKELSEEYEQRASYLSKTITELTSPEDTKRIKKEVKDLRNASERINIGLSSNVDNKLFDYLLNFELNNRDGSKDKVVGPEWSVDLFNYGHDINRLSQTKKRVASLFDKLSSKEGFDKFFKEADDIRNQEVPEEEEVTTPPVIEEGLPKFKNKSGEEEVILADREYQIPASKKARLDKIADDRWQVTSPDGTITFYPTEARAKQEVDDLNEEFGNLQKVKVLGINPDGSIKVEDIAGNIVNVPSSRFEGYEKIQTPQEKLQKFSEDLTKDQDQIENKSGSIGTNNLDIDLSNMVKESPKKNLSWLFKSTTATSEDADINTFKAFEVKAISFRNNVKTFPNRKNMRIMLVTQNQEKSLGLEGLANLAMGSVGTHTDIDNGLVAAVYVEQSSDGTYFVNEKGERIGKVGDKIDVNNVVFDSMPTTSLTFRSGEDRFRKTDKIDDVKEEAASWKLKREQLFKADKPELYGFTISRGIPDITDQFERNSVGKTLIDEDLIETQEGLIVIPTTGTISHQGETINFPNGRPVLQYGDTLQFLNNKKFSKQEAEAIFEVMKFMSQAINKQLASGKRIKIDPNYSEFLQNVLYWRKGPVTSGNQIYIDVKTMDFYFNGKRYDLTKIEDSKDDIVSSLQDVYNNVNNTTLTKSFNDRFKEYYLDNGALKTREWTNYQTYLLSSKNPDGSARGASTIPLTTAVREKTSLKPFNFKQKYAILDGLDFPKVQKAEPQKAAEPVTPSKKEEGVNIGGYTLNTGAPNKYKLNSGKEVIFTGSVDENGEFSVKVLPNDTIKELSTKETVEKIMPTLKELIPDLKEGLDNDLYISKFIEYQIIGTLKEEQAKQQPAEEVVPAQEAPVTPAPTASVSDIEKYGVQYYNARLLGKNLDLKQPLQKGKQYIRIKFGNDFVAYAAEIVTGSGEMYDYTFMSGYTGAGTTKPSTTKLSSFYDSNGKLVTNVSPESLGYIYEIPTIDITDKKALAAALVESNYLKSQPIGSAVGVKNTQDKKFTLKYYDLNFDVKEVQLETPLGKARNEFIKEFLRKQYDTELAALEGAKPSEPVVASGKKNFNKIKRKTGDESEYRRVGRVEKVKYKISELELQLLKEWHAENIPPSLPYEVLENIVLTHDGERAYGVYENGVAKFYKGALRGTEYHEIFEGIWKSFLTQDERNDILEEFRSKKGSFVDRASGKKIDYNEATDQEAKERIADDFAEFRAGKLPARSIGEKILRFFRSIIEFFKQFVQKPSKKEELFKAIDTGKFKERKPLETKDNAFSEYKKIGNLSEKQVNEFVQDIAAKFFQIVFGTNRSLYDIQLMTSSDIFNDIREDYVNDGYIDDNDPDVLSNAEYDELVQRTKNLLRTFKIEFDESEKLTINDENRDKNEYAKDPFTTNWKKNSPFPVKLLIGTLIETESTNQENENLDLPKAKRTEDLNTLKLLNFGRAFATLIDKLSNTTNVKSFVDKIVDVAKSDSNYVRLFTRLGGNRKGKEKIIDFSKFEGDDWRLFINFYQTFTKQKPDAVIQYVTDGDVYSSPANLFTSIKEVKRGWLQNMRGLAKAADSIIVYDFDNKTISVKEEIKSLPIRSTQDKIDFLGKLGIVFPIDAYGRLQTRGDEDQKKMFGDAVSAIRSYLGSEKDIMSLSGKTLTVDAQLETLAELLVKVTNPDQEVTYFGLDQKRIQSYADNNAVSLLENEFNSANTLDDLLDNVRPELKDVFSRNSVILKKGGLFFDKKGKRIRNLKVKYIQGTKDSETGKDTTTSKLNIGDRFVQEMNQNLNGNYYVLVPADSSTEWMMNMGNHVKFSELSDSKVYDIFRGYLEDDIAIALENRTSLKNVEPRARELRFFKEILPENLLAEFNSLINSAISNNDVTDSDFKNLIDKNIDAINKAVDKYIDNTVQNTRDILFNSRQIFNIEGDRYSFKNLDGDFVKREKLGSKDKLDIDDINNIIRFANLNYIINNIEYHKVIFGDPYQFAIKDGQLDETKRIKSFLSPRRKTFDSPEFNTFLNQKMNNAGDIKLTPDDPGYHTHKSYTNTVTLSDVEIVGSVATLKNIPKEIQDKFAKKAKETDGVSWIMDTTYREVKMKNGQWDMTGNSEKWHQWQMAYTRQNMPGYEYTDQKLKEQDAKLVESPMPEFMVDVLKPIVSGNRKNATGIELVLDKFSQMPIYFSMVQGTNLEKMYIKMWKEQRGYAVVLSGRKVGAGQTHNIYNSDGSFNETPFNNLVEVPWSAYGIQVENSYEGPKEQTRGSQITKLSSIDLFDNGEGSEDAKKEYARNKELLDLMHENGYKSLLKRLGIQDLGDSFFIEDNISLSKTLEYEVLRREMSSNVEDSLQLDANKQFIIPFEASTAYIQIRDILFSMVDKAVISPKMNGGAHVQVPVTMWENAGNRELIKKEADGSWKKINSEQYNKLSDEEKKKVVFTDTTLKFYTRENPYCEILLPHWFQVKLNKTGKFKSEKQLITYLNNSEEGKEILKGIGFRIPTQSLSSVEVFRVKGFLPKSMGSTVVVPSEIVTKAGSDFDIDKLNMYLKATYIDKNGDIRLVKYMDNEENTREFYANVFDEKLEKEKVSKARLLEALDIMTYGLDDPNGLFEKYSDILEDMLSEVQDASDAAASVMEQLEKLGDATIQQELKDRFVDSMYKKSLENEYYASLERMITLPENFDRLISPVDDAGLKALSEKLDRLRGVNEANIPNRVLDRNYMTTLRHAFITAKKWVGIAAVNITGQSLTQKSKVYIDPSRFANIPALDKILLGDGSIILPHNTIEIDGKKYVSISGRKTADGKQYISDRLSGYATSFVDVAKDPYIMKIIKSDLVVGTFMFLERIGAGETAALFMNQPIIVDYLNNLESSGSKNLFSQGNILDIITQYGGSGIKDDVKFDVGNLEKNIGSKEVNEEEQIAIFSAFLRYAKMAEYSFKLTQATNYDTTKFRSSGALYRKQLRTEAARENNIFSSVDKILEESFIGEQSSVLAKLVESLGTIFKLDKYEFRNITNAVLKPFASDDFLSADNYSRIENKIIASFLDYIIQTKSGISNDIKKLMLDSEESIDKRLASAKEKYPDIEILDRLDVVESPTMENGAKTVKLKVNSKEAYDENLHIGMMRELRDYNEEMNKLYKDIVKLSILQGTYQSAVSIKNVIPIEDYSEIVSPIIRSLIADVDVKAFADGYFQRNNFKDADLFKIVNPKFFIAKSWDEDIEDVQPKYEDPYGNYIYQYISPYAFPNIVPLNVKSSERRILILNETFNYLDTLEDFVIVPRIVVDSKSKVMIDMVTGENVTQGMLSEAKKKGNNKYKAVYGYQKVKHKNGTPLTYNSQYKGENMVNHVYKLVNLYGDSPLTTEYYTDFRPSVLDNNTMKPSLEIPDGTIIDYFAPQIREQMMKSIPEEASAPVQVAPVVTSGEKINIYAGTGENADLSNFANRPFNYNGQKFTSVEQAFQYAKGEFYNVYEIDPNSNKTPADLKAVVDSHLANILKAKTGAEAKALGRKNIGIGFENSMWDGESSNIMKALLTESFKQNPDALAKLLATGNAELTHTQDKGKWGKEFPKLLMEVREELRSAQTPKVVNEYGLTDANFETVPDYAMAISYFYEALTPEQQAKLGSLIDIVSDYESIPFEYSYDEYIESLKCKL